MVPSPVAFVVGVFLLGMVGSACAESESAPKPTWVGSLLKAQEARTNRADSNALPSLTTTRKMERKASKPVSNLSVSDSVTNAERSLHGQGARFGTDGNPRSVYSYMRYSQRLVGTTDVQPGDVLFFDMGNQGCGDHIGVVESVEPRGRISFRESRDGRTRVSFVNPREPNTRRDRLGRVINTFLRPKKLIDPSDTRYFAGELLCAIGRVDGE
jgi:hypothetical protein